MNIPKLSPAQKRNLLVAYRNGKEHGTYVFLGSSYGPYSALRDLGLAIEWPHGYTLLHSPHGTHFRLTTTGIRLAAILFDDVVDKPV